MALPHGMCHQILLFACLAEQWSYLLLHHQRFGGVVSLLPESNLSLFVVRHGFGQQLMAFQYYRSNLALLLMMKCAMVDR